MAHWLVISVFVGTVAYYVYTFSTRAFNETVENTFRNAPNRAGSAPIAPWMDRR